MVAHQKETRPSHFFWTPCASAFSENNKIWTYIQKCRSINPMVPFFSVKFGSQFFAYLEKFANLFVDFLSLNRSLERHPSAVKVKAFHPHPGWTKMYR